MLREAQRALTLAVFVSGILGVLIYPGADALMEFLFLIASHARSSQVLMRKVEPAPSGRSDVIFMQLCDLKIISFCDRAKQNC